MTWAEAERPSTALVIASGFLSNPAKDWLEAYVRNRHPPFRIRHWEKPILQRLLAKHPDMMGRHGIIAEEMRTTAEIIAAEQEFFDKVWYVRSLIREEAIERGEDARSTPDIEEGARRARQAVEERYGAGNVGPWGDWEWGYVNGKLATLRWVLGMEWDFLNT
jgi:hypothetical protein